MDARVKPAHDEPRVGHVTRGKPIAPRLILIDATRYSAPGFCPSGLCADLLCLDVCRLDDRPPLLDLGLVKCAERLRRLLLAWKNLVP
jgi:hypothetical protein